MICNSSKMLRRGMRRCQYRSAAAAAMPPAFLESPVTTNQDTQQRLLHINLSTAIRTHPILPTFRQQTIYPQSRYMSGCSQYFDNESEYHTVADETLEDLQDAVEIAIEDNDIGGNDVEQPEVVYASGVLTMSFPPHGTWVLNKQTPNRQIWWSSPISGPRRYEYDPDSSEWVYTRSGDGSEETLSKAITDEFQEIYGIELDM